jgi:long-chain fatty acid transport protein
MGYNVNKNFMVHVGLALQELQADVRLRDLTYQSSSGYNNRFDNLAVGWVTGMSFAKPELGILASLTYRSEIEHSAVIQEDVLLADLIGFHYSYFNDGSITTPEPVNLHFQTGLNPITAFYVKVRWVPWSDFAYYLPVLKATTGYALKNSGLALVNFHDDQTAVELDVGKCLSPKVAMSISSVWDSSANIRPS